MSRYQFIQACTEPWPMRVLCRLLAVSSAGYYQWRQRPAPPVAAWEPAAQAAFTRHARRYGTRRLRAELRAEGHAVGRYALRSWLHRQGLRALSTRPQRPRTTVADPAAVVAENRLLGQPATRSGSATLPTCPCRAGGRAVLLGHVARHRFAPGRGLAPGRADAHRTRAPGLGTSPDATPARARTHYPRRLGQPVHQRRLPRSHRPGRHLAQLQPAATPATTPGPKPAGARSKRNCCPVAVLLLRWKKPGWKSLGTLTRV